MQKYLKTLIFANVYVFYIFFYLKKFVYQQRSKNPYLIGDSAYPLLPYCMGEYSTYKSNQEVIFNSKLRRAGNPIKWLLVDSKLDDS